MIIYTRQQPLRLDEMRPVDHLSVKLGNAESGIVPEQRNNRARVSDFGFCRSEGGIDRRDL